MRVYGPQSYPNCRVYAVGRYDPYGDWSCWKGIKFINYLFVEILMKQIKWWALYHVANDDAGGDNQRVFAQCYFWWPSNIQPGE